jgi:hypothetical protein
MPPGTPSGINREWYVCTLYRFYVKSISANIAIVQRDMSLTVHYIETHLKPSLVAVCRAALSLVVLE